MTTPEVLVLVRHAESERNMARRIGVFLADDAARREVGMRPDHLVRLTARAVSYTHLTLPTNREV